MDLNREYSYNAERAILLMCDYYETEHISQDMYNIKDNIALFPVANVPLIDLILCNLLSQNFYNVIIAGKQIDNLLEHLAKTQYLDIMNISVFRSTGDSLGDLFRELDFLRFEFRDLIVMYANAYTNINLSLLLKRHKEAKTNILTLYTYENKSNDNNTHVYGTVGQDVVFYQKVANEQIESADLFSALPKRKSILVDTTSSGPTIAVVSSQVFAIFAENFDYRTLGDLMVGVLASKLYDSCFQVVKDDDLLSKRHHPAGGYSESDLFFSEKHGERAYGSPFYSREIITLLDYYNFNKDVAENQSVIIKAPIDIQIIKGMINTGIVISNSFVGDCCSIDGNIQNCIIWDNCKITGDHSGRIVFSDNIMFDVCHLELDSYNSNSSEMQEESSDEEENENQSFFSNVNSLLHEHVTTARFYDNDMVDVYKQVSLLRIVWNASQVEVIEAFGFFFVDMLDLDNLEDSLSKASVFFGIIANYITDKQDEECLMETIYNNVYEMDPELKVQILFNYGFLFVQDKIIDKSVVKKYNKMYKAGIL